MALMAASDRTKLAQRFASELTRDVHVRLRVHEGECGLCAQAEAIVRETTDLAPQLLLSVEAGGGTLPEIRLEGAARGRVRFFGPPSGYEFPAFIDSFVEVSTGETTLNRDAVDRLAAIGRPLHIQVFTTPT